MKIRLRLLARDLRRRALDDHLALKRDPRKHERRARVGLEFATFATVVIRIENETAPVEALEQNRARRRPAVAGRSCERRRIWLDQLRALGLLKPFLKLPKRILRQIFLE